MGYATLWISKGETSGKSKHSSLELLDQKLFQNSGKQEMHFITFDNYSTSKPLFQKSFCCQEMLLLVIKALKSKTTLVTFHTHPPQTITYIPELPAVLHQFHQHIAQWSTTVARLEASSSFPSARLERTRLSAHQTRLACSLRRRYTEYPVLSDQDRRTRSTVSPSVQLNMCSFPPLGRQGSGKSSGTLCRVSGALLCRSHQQGRGTLTRASSTPSRRILRDWKVRFLRPNFRGSGNFCRHNYPVLES